MKNKLFWSLMILPAIILFASCSKAGTEPGDEIVVALHDCSQKTSDPYICFDSLLTDSRCPTGVECVWQGTALIKVTFSERGNSHQFVMSLKDFPDLGYPEDTTINGYRIIFTDLKPYPDINNPKPKEVKAFFNISR